MGAGYNEGEASSARRRQNTNPGVGPPSGPKWSASGEGAADVADDQVSSEQDDSSDGAEVVDFDALNAALGALPPPPTPSSPNLGAADSEGRSSATYSSARPHTIPPSHAPNEDLNAPAVIVQVDETIPTGPPVQMTMPMGPGVNVVATAPHPVSGPPDGMRPPMTSSPGHPFTPQPFPTPGTSSDVTVPMGGLPRRPRTPTIVVERHTGPSRGQRIAVFVSMLLVFVGGGVAFLLLYRPQGIGVELRPATSTRPSSTVRVVETAPASASATAPLPEPVVSMSAGLPLPPATASVAASALPSASAPPRKPKPRAPAPAPTLTAPL